MANKRFLELAARLRNESPPARKKLPKVASANGTSTGAPYFGVTPDSAFILSYDDFGKELIRKSNALFAGTDAEIPLADSGEVQEMYLLRRLALVTVLSLDTNLRKANVWPITPLQSEQLLKAQKLGNPSEYWEDLGLVLYDRSENGANSAEAKALYESIKKHRSSLGLSASDLEARLVVVHAGLEKDGSMQHGVKPIVIPGITHVYTHPALKQSDDNYTFEYGLDRGLPAVKDLNKGGDRTFYLPDEQEDIGLRVLIRDGSLDLVARVNELANSGANGRVNFARQGDAPKKKK